MDTLKIPPPSGGGKPTLVTSPILVPAKAAAALCGRSVASWWRDLAAGRVPAPLKLGGRTLWRVEELREWVEADCPPRAEWEGRRR